MRLEFALKPFARAPAPDERRARDRGGAASAEGGWSEDEL